MARVKKLKVNNTEYDIKDAVARKVENATRANETLTGDELTLYNNIVTDIRSAVGDNPEDPTASGGTIDDIVEGLAALNKKVIDAKNNSIISIGMSNGTISTTKGDGTAGSSISKSTIVTGLRDTVTSSSSTSSTAGFTTPADAQMLIDRAQIGAAMMQDDDLRSDDTQLTSGQKHLADLTNYKAGYYWVVTQAGTYGGLTPKCEVGDFIYAVSDYDTSFKASDFKVVQANIDPTIYAQKGGDTYTGTHNFTGATVNVKTPTADANAATKKYVDDAVSGASGNDKIKDYAYIPFTSTATLGSTTTLPSNVISAMTAAYEANKIPVLGITFSALSDAQTIVPISVPQAGTDVMYAGTAAMSYNDKPVSVTVAYSPYASASSLAVSLAPVTGVTVTPSSDNLTYDYASYADEVITFNKTTNKSVVVGVTTSVS